jgi:hypothetical protein
MFRIVPTVLVAASLLVPAAGAARTELKPTVGFNWSDVTKDPATGSAQGKFGWQIGGTVAFGERLYFEGGAFYARKSADITATDGSNSIDFEGLTGVRVPAMIGFRLLDDPGKSDSFDVRAFGGGAVFFVTSVDATGLSTSDVESPTYGVFVGAGVDILIFFADLKYEWSLTDVSKLDTVDVGSSRAVYLNAGLRF